MSIYIRGKHLNENLFYCWGSLDFPYWSISVQEKLFLTGHSHIVIIYYENATWKSCNFDKNCIMCWQGFVFFKKLFLPGWRLQVTYSTPKLLEQGKKEAECGDGVGSTVGCIISTIIKTRLSLQKFFFCNVGYTVRPFLSIYICRNQFLDNIPVFK